MAKKSEPSFDAAAAARAYLDGRIPDGVGMQVPKEGRQPRPKFDGAAAARVYLAEPNRPASTYDPNYTLPLPTGDGAIVCPRCQTRGHVSTKHVTVKRGVSGGKATAGILTGGVSLFVVGLSRKNRTTQANCTNCGSSDLWGNTH